MLKDQWLLLKYKLSIQQKSRSEYFGTGFFLHLKQVLFRKTDTYLNKKSRFEKSGIFCWLTRTRTLNDCTKNSSVTITP